MESERVLLHVVLEHMRSLDLTGASTQDTALAYVATFMVASWGVQSRASRLWTQSK